MKREFIYLKAFEKHWYDLGLNEADIEKLEMMIMDNPDTGDLIQGAGGLRKMRFTLPDKGKRGGVRILYVDFISYEKTILVDIYSKSHKENITDAQRQEFKKLIGIIARELK